jgi:hypothetical protein
MEEKKPKHTPAPGIPEALHPQIGNGAAWEKEMHEFLLRNPDASKQLEWRLHQDGILPNPTASPLLSETNVHIAESKTVDPSHLESITTGQSEIETIAFENHSVEAGDSSIDESSSSAPDQTEKVKSKSKKKAARAEKSGQDSDSQIEDPKTEKPQKAGKLIKKAAKTVKRQDAEKSLPESSEIILREITLSPYTNWLKNLAGSEYVHPYDEDYAFNQGVDPSRGGISETFADLLASQGYKEQAIEMYMRLMEKYPEKSSFFAAKIEALQQQ